MKKLLSIILIYMSIINGHNYDYDLIVIGGGLAGVITSILSSDLDKRVAIIEKNKIGGTRIWSGDCPFNAFLKEAEIYYALQHNKFDYGFIKNGIKPNLNIIFERITSIQERIYNSVDWDYLNKCNAVVFYGEPRFLEKNTLTLHGKVITAHNIMIATGTRSRIPTITNLENVNYFTRENFFTMKKLPNEALIVGGGPLGVEIAATLSCFGVKVKLFMKHHNILPDRDGEMITLLKQLLKKRNVEIYCNTEAVSVKQDGEVIQITTLNDKNNKQIFKGDSLFIATGSVPNIEKLDLDRIGLKYNSKGIPVNKKFQTNISNILACGDVIGWESQSRWVEFQAKSVIHHLYKNHFTDYEDISNLPIARAIFSSPLFVSIGLTEEEALNKYGHKVKVYKRSYDIIERAHIDQTTEGLIKFICNDRGILLGAHIFGEQAETIIEGIKLGEDIRNTFKKIPTKVSVWSNYFDLIERLGYDCFNDLKNDEEKNKPSFISSIISYFGL